MKILEINSSDIIFNEIENAGENFDSVFGLDIDINDDDTIDGKGFVGNALIYDNEIYINTFTGEGYDLVIGKMKNYIDWYSGKIRLSGFERDDIKQLITMILLDGIRRYNPRLKIKLSTFLYVHIKNRIISRIKEETRQSLNATYNEQLHKFICKCGTSLMANRAEASNIICASCKSKVDNTWLIRAEHFEPISLDGITSSYNDEDGAGEKSSAIYYNGQKNHIVDFFGRIINHDDLDKNLDFAKILSNEDKTTRKIAELMYYKDYSITDAAKEVGLTCWAASLRLKKLKNKKNISDYFINS